MISNEAGALDELLGNLYIARSVGEYYEDSRIGARVTDRLFASAFIIGHLRNALCAYVTGVRTFLEEGTFWVPYPRYENRVSPQCASRSDNPDDYVVRKGPDGVCRMYLRRDRAPRSSAVLCVGGMTAPRYLTELLNKADPNLENEAKAIDALEQDSTSKHTIVITRIYGGMLGPEDHLGEDNLETLIKPFPEIIDEVFEMGRTGKTAQPYDWMKQHIAYALDHHAKYVWVAD
ncbi:hypothetical protein HY622_01095 [Candidatus Uhrbacteria bacterium]|nr:hypothetical protein [Candidatus Uhrbacteria bacterium]